MEKVKKAVDAGISFGTAVRENIGGDAQEFCRKNKLIRQEFSAMLNGRRVPDDKQIAALIKAAGGSRRGWLDLWFATAQRRAAVVGQ